MRSNITQTSKSVKLNLDQNNYLFIFGSVNINPQLKLIGRIDFLGATQETITTNGSVIEGKIISDKTGGGLTLTDNLILTHIFSSNITTTGSNTNYGEFTINEGDLNISGKELRVNYFNSNYTNTNVRNFNFDNAKILIKEYTGIQTLTGTNVSAPGRVYSILSGTFILTTNSNVSQFSLTSTNFTLEVKEANLTENIYINNQLPTKLSFPIIKRSGLDQNSDLITDNFYGISAQKIYTQNKTQQSFNQCEVDSVFFITNFNFTYGQSDPVRYPEYNESNNSKLYFKSSIVNVIHLGTPLLNSNTPITLVGPQNAYDRYTNVSLINTPVNTIYGYPNLSYGLVLYGETFIDKVSMNGNGQVKTGDDPEYWNAPFTNNPNNKINSLYVDKYFEYTSDNQTGNYVTFRKLILNTDAFLKNNLTSDTISFNSGYTYTIGNDKNIKINNKIYISGNPCYLNEIISEGVSTTSKLTYNGPNTNVDYIRFRGIKSIGTGQITALQHSINIINNTGINFLPYNANQHIKGLGNDTAICSSAFPYTLNSTDFLMNPSSQFTWFDGTNTPTKNVSTYGKYHINVNYGRGCAISDTIEIIDPIKIATTAVTNNCDGTAFNGEIVTNTTGSYAPFTYNWNTSPAQTSNTASNISAGNYTLTVTDNKGCTKTKVITVNGLNAGDVFTAQFLPSNILPDCDPTTTGTGYAKVTTTGGSAPFTYIWDNNPAITTQERFQLNNGNYTVEVTDVNGCKRTQNVTIGTAAGSVDATIATTNPSNCNIDGSAIVTLVAGTAPISYNWSNAPSNTSNTNTGLNGGAYTVNVIDANQCSKLINYSILPGNTTAPVISDCPSNIIINSSTTTCGNTVTWTEPKATDECAGITTSSTHQPGANFPVGTTTVIYTFQDIYKNTSTCQFTVTVIDHVAPVLSPMNNVVLTAAQGNCIATASWIPPSATDNCQVQSLTANFASGSIFPIGSTKVTYVATDIYGNKDSVSFHVIIKTNPLDFKYSCRNPMGYLVYSIGYFTQLTSPVYTNNCSVKVNFDYNAFITTNPLMINSGSVVCNNPMANVYSSFPFNTVTEQPLSNQFQEHYVIYSNGSDSLTCKYGISLSDNEYPTITNFNPDYIGGDYKYVSITQTGCTPTTYSWDTLVPADNCGIQSVTANYTSGQVFTPGNYNITILVKDIYNNTSAYTIYLSVLTPEPTIQNCPSNISAIQNVCAGKAVSWTPPTVSSGCYTAFTSTHQPGDIFPLGTTTVTYTLTSPNFGTKTCSFTVTVSDYPNQITYCPADIIITLNANECSRSVTWTVPSFDYPCMITSLTANFTSGHVFAPGTYTVNHSATFSNGKTATCTFNITVINTTPLVTVTNCPSFNSTYNSNAHVQQVNTAVSCIEDVAHLVIPQFQAGLCSSPIATLQYTGTVSNGQVTPVGQYPITFEALDASNNVLATCSYTYVLIDTVTRIDFVNCPQDSTIYVTTLCQKSIIDYTMPSTLVYGCISLDSLHANINPGDTLAASQNGTIHTVNINSYANGSIVSTCTFDLMLIDTMNFVEVVCPPTTLNPITNEQEIISVLDMNNCYNTQSWADPIFSAHGCLSPITVTRSFPANFHYPIGTANIDYTAYIGSTAVGNCNFNFVVKIPDTLIHIPNDTVIYTDPISCKARVNWNLPYIVQNNCFTSGIYINSYSYNWSENSLNPNNNNGNQNFPIGTYTIEYSYYNGSGINYINYTIKVVDGTQLSFINCPTDTIQLYSEFNSCNGRVTWPTPQLNTSNCTSNFVSEFNATFEPNSLIPIGMNDAVYQAVSITGDTATCAFKVKVIDIQAPSIYACPSDIKIYSDSSNCTAEVSWTKPGFFDNCDNYTITASHFPKTRFAVGKTTVSYIITDIAGNSATCEFDVEVITYNGSCVPLDPIIPNDTIKPDTSKTVQLVIPEAITPDGDGKNDYFVIKGIEKYPNNQLQIYNRWGSLVYLKTSYQNEWNGLINVTDAGFINSEVPTGTYYYVLDTQDPSVGILKGYVFLKR